MKVYKSEEGKRLIREATKALYAQSPVPTESIEIQLKEYGTTHVLAAGDPKAAPLILLHGTSFNSAHWIPFFPQWIKHFRIYALDFPGQPGLSDETRPPFKEGVYPRWIDQVTDALGVESFHLAGFSMGGLFAIEYLMRGTKKVKSAALVSPGGLAHTRPLFFPGLFFRLLFGKTGIKMASRFLRSNAPLTPEEEEFNMLVMKYFIPVPPYVPVFTDKEIKKISGPVLFLAGVKDVMLNTVKGAKRLKSLIPKAEIHQLEETGHILVPEKGNILTSFFLKFQ